MPTAASKAKAAAERADVEKQIERLELLRSSPGNYPPMNDNKTAARLYGINYETYKKITSSRRVTPRDALIIANYHKVSVAWVLYGIGSPEAQYAVPLRGELHPGLAMQRYDAGRTTDAVACHTGSCFAVVLKDDVYPLLRRGDCMFFAEMSRPIADLIGEYVAAETSDGEVYVRVLEAGSGPGLHSLHSIAGSPPIRDVVLKRAGRFLGLRRAAATAALVVGYLLHCNHFGFV